MKKAEHEILKLLSEVEEKEKLIETFKSESEKEKLVLS